jgi:hypothetical protein
MREVLRGMEAEDLEPLPRCPDQALGVQVVKHAHPHSYATMPILQQAIVRLKWHYGVHKVVQEFRTNPALGSLAADPITCNVRDITKNGVKAACIWFVRGIP